VSAELPAQELAEEVSSSRAPGMLPRRASAGIRTRVHTPRRPFELRLGQVWAYRRAIPYLGWSVALRRFRGTWLGWLWFPLRPGLQILSRAFVFGGLLQVSSGTRPYLIFLLVGQAGWDFFDKAVYWSFRPLNTHRRILSGTPIPWAAAVVSALIPAGVDAAQYALFGGIASVYYKLTRGSFYIQLGFGSGLRLLLGILLLALWAVAIGLIIAPLIVKARDIRFMVRYVISFWYFLTPVLYATSSLPHQYRVLANYNPITAPIELIKDSLLATGKPGSTSLLISCIGLAVLLPLGLLVCSFFERQAHARL
jgi:ABC-type polysaccharide/polyol phosphate export permease